jgi:hypothetical protein
MRPHLITAATLTLALLSASGPDARAAKPAPDVPVHVMLADSANGALLRVGSDADPLDGYSPSSQVASVIQPRPTGSDWLFTTFYNKRGAVTWTRGARIDLTEQDEASGFPTPLGGPTTVAVHFKVGCSEFGVDMLRLGAGQAVTCPGGFRFLAPTSGRWYRLAFNPNNYPEVSPLIVTCTSAGSAGCTMWTITPSGSPTAADPNPKNLGRLLEIDDSGIVLALGGTYFASFSITLRR